MGNNMINMHSTRRDVTISFHARQRLRERLPEVDEREYKNFVKRARYDGKSLDDPSLPAHIYKFVRKRFHSNNSTKIIIYNNAIFVFCGNKGHARTLRTVVNIPEHILNKKET